MTDTPTPPTPPMSPNPVNPQEAVKLPGMLLMIYGAVTALGQLLFLALSFLGIGLNAVNGGNGAMAGMMSGAIGVVVRLLMLVLCGVIILGGMKMQKLQSYNLAMAAAVVALLPCSCPCCLIGIPLGIWALVVLMKPEVKAAFTA